MWKTANSCIYDRCFGEDSNQILAEYNLQALFLELIFSVLSYQMEAELINLYGYNFR